MLNRKISKIGRKDNFIYLGFNNHKDNMICTFETKEEADKYRSQLKLGSNLSWCKYIKYKLCRHENIKMHHYVAERFSQEYCTKCGKEYYTDLETDDYKVMKWEKAYKNFDKNEILELHSKIKRDMNELYELKVKYIEKYNENPLD